MARRLNRGQKKSSSKKKSIDPLIFVAIHKGDGGSDGFGLSISPTLEIAKEINPPKEEKPQEENNGDLKTQASFAALHGEISSAIAAHRALEQVVSMLDRVKGRLQVQFHIEPALQRFGSAVHEDDSRKVYSLSPMHAGEVVQAIRNTASGIVGIAHLPRLLLVGLVSEYDVFLQKLIRVGLSSQSGVAARISRTIELNELRTFGSIEEACDYLVEREIEEILHDSHFSQLVAIGKLFNVKFDMKDICVRDFLEICERRNLFTHNAGVVNARYVNKCVEYGVDVAAVKVGDKLDVSKEYFRKSISTIQEISTKITQFVWRKLVPGESDRADSELNSLAFELLKGDDYDLARKMLDYGVNHTGKGQDMIRRMMVVNYANALKLGGDKSSAMKELEKLDWSATGLKFQLSVAAVRDDVKEVVKLMKAAKKSDEIAEQDYRTWPVFKLIKNEVSFQDEFRSLYGSEVIAVPTQVIADDSQSLVRKALEDTHAASKATKH